MQKLFQAHSEVDWCQTNIRETKQLIGAYNLIYFDDSIEFQYILNVEINMIIKPQNIGML